MPEKKESKKEFLTYTRRTLTGVVAAVAVFMSGKEGVSHLWENVMKFPENVKNNPAKVATDFTKAVAKDHVKILDWPHIHVIAPEGYKFVKSLSKDHNQAADKHSPEQTLSQEEQQQLEHELEEKFSLLEKGLELLGELLVTELFVENAYIYFYSRAFKGNLNGFIFFILINKARMNSFALKKTQQMLEKAEEGLDKFIKVVTGTERDFTYKYKNKYGKVDEQKASNLKWFFDDISFWRNQISSAKLIIQAGIMLPEHPNMSLYYDMVNALTSNRMVNHLGSGFGEIEDKARNKKVAGLQPKKSQPSFLTQQLDKLNTLKAKLTPAKEPSKLQSPQIKEKDEDKASSQAQNEVSPDSASAPEPDTQLDYRQAQELIVEYTRDKLYNPDTTEAEKSNFREQLYQQPWIIGKLKPILLAHPKLKEALFGQSHIEMWRKEGASLHQLLTSPLGKSRINKAKEFIKTRLFPDLNPRVTFNWLKLRTKALENIPKLALHQSTASMEGKGSQKKQGYRQEYIANLFKSLKQENQTRMGNSQEFYDLYQTWEYKDTKLRALFADAYCQWFTLQVSLLLKEFKQIEQIPPDKLAGLAFSDFSHPNQPLVHLKTDLGEIEENLLYYLKKLYAQIDEKQEGQDGQEEEKKEDEIKSRRQIEVMLQNYLEENEIIKREDFGTFNNQVKNLMLQVNQTDDKDANFFTQIIAFNQENKKEMFKKSIENTIDKLILFKQRKSMQYLEFDEAIDANFFDTLNQLREVMRRGFSDAEADFDAEGKIRFTQYRKKVPIKEVVQEQDEYGVKQKVERETGMFYELVISENELAEVKEGEEVIEDTIEINKITNLKFLTQLREAGKLEVALSSDEEDFNRYILEVVRDKKIDLPSDFASSPDDQFNDDYHWRGNYEEGLNEDNLWDGNSDSVTDEEAYHESSYWNNNQEEEFKRVRSFNKLASVVRSVNEYRSESMIKTETVPRIVEEVDIRQMGLHCVDAQRGIYCRPISLSKMLTLDPKYVAMGKIVPMPNKPDWFIINPAFIDYHKLFGRDLAAEETFPDYGFAPDEPYVFLKRETLVGQCLRDENLARNLLESASEIKSYQAKEAVKFEQQPVSIFPKINARSSSQVIDESEKESRFKVYLEQKEHLEITDDPRIENVERVQSFLRLYGLDAFMGFKQFFLTTQSLLWQILEQEPDDFKKRQMEDNFVVDLHSDNPSLQTEMTRDIALEKSKQHPILNLEQSGWKMHLATLALQKILPPEEDEDKKVKNKKVKSVLPSTNPLEIKEETKAFIENLSSMRNTTPFEAVCIYIKEELTDRKALERLAQEGEEIIYRDEFVPVLKEGEEENKEGKQTKQETVEAEPKEGEEGNEPEFIVVQKVDIAATKSLNRGLWREVEEQVIALDDQTLIESMLTPNEFINLKREWRGDFEKIKLEKFKDLYPFINFKSEDERQKIAQLFSLMDEFELSPYLFLYDRKNRTSEGGVLIQNLAHIGNATLRPVLKAAAGTVNLPLSVVNKIASTNLKVPSPKLHITTESTPRFNPPAYTQPYDEIFDQGLLNFLVHFRFKNDASRTKREAVNLTKKEEKNKQDTLLTKFKLLTASKAYRDLQKEVNTRSENDLLKRMNDFFYQIELYKKDAQFQNKESDDASNNPPPDYYQSRLDLSRKL